MNRGLVAAIIIVGLLIGGCSLAGDVTPPPAIATAQMAAPAQPPAQPPTPVPISPPSTQPDIAAGALIYADKCAGCHGPEGLGNGELADRLEFEPAPLGDPDFAREADPLEWYRAVTIGNLDRLMPGFVSLTDQQRWDVVGYALSLSGDSPPAQVEVEQEPIAQPGDSPPAEVEVQQEPIAQPGSVVGQVTMGSIGATLPAGLEVSLLGYDGEQEVVNEQIVAERDGKFTFEGLEYVSGRLFLTSVVHDGLTYRSDVIHAAIDGSAISLPITIYESTNDPSSMRVERLHVILDLPAENVLRVLELWILANDSNQMLTTPLRIALPEGATNLTFEDGDLGGRYQITDDGFVDLEPIPPGRNIDHLTFGFDMPISGSMDFDQQILHPVDAAIVLTSADGAQLRGLLDRGVQDVGGQRMQSFTTGALAPDEPLAFQVSTPSTSSSPPLEAIVGVGALIVAALVAARFLARARRVPQTIGQENWVEAIARLDDDYEAGVLSEDEWRPQRDKLKSQALDQMRRSDD